MSSVSILYCCFNFIMHNCSACLFTYSALEIFGQNWGRQKNANLNLTQLLALNLSNEQVLTTFIHKTWSRLPQEKEVFLLLRRTRLRSAKICRPRRLTGWHCRMQTLFSRAVNCTNSLFFLLKRFNIV